MDLYFLLSSVCTHLKSRMRVSGIIILQAQNAGFVADHPIDAHLAIKQTKGNMSQSIRGQCCPAQLDAAGGAPHPVRSSVK